MPLIANANTILFISRPWYIVDLNMPFASKHGIWSGYTWDIHDCQKWELLLTTYRTLYRICPFVGHVYFPWGSRGHGTWVEPRLELRMRLGVDLPHHDAVVIQRPDVPVWQRRADDDQRFGVGVGASVMGLRHPGEADVHITRCRSVYPCRNITCNKSA